MGLTWKASADVETARRGSRACLFDGNPARVDTPAYDWTGWSPATRWLALIDDKATTVLVLPCFTCEVDAYCNLVLRA